MPGVHVRTLSQLDWLEQEKDSVLTIPGSYWLCYKKNIYKFIFRYHRTMKNTTQFSYGKELLKVIRRIIKCHPTHGQQFGTQHLLVTYNCTFWTRQDKMFAILKFQRQTNAAAFSHAFVLTIKVCSSLDESLFNLKYPTIKEVETDATFKDLKMLPNVKKKNKTMICNIDEISPTNTEICQSKKINQATKHDENTLNRISEISVNYDMQNNTIDKPVNFCESLDTNNESTVSCITDNKYIDNIDKKSRNHTYKSDFINYNSRTLETRTKHNINDTSSNNVNKTKSETNIKTKSDNQNKNIHKYIFSSTKSTISEVIKDNDVDEWPLSNRFSIDKNSAEKGNVTPIKNKNSLKDNIETTGKVVIESSDVPYQYFIEKEIENTKYNMNIDTVFSNNRRPVQETLQVQNMSEIKNTDENFLAKMLQKDNDFNKNEHQIVVMKPEQENTQHVSVCKVYNNQEQNNTYTKSHKFERRRRKNGEFDRHNVPNDKISQKRSSNITDLVMEGLMFTIRQDEDSVSVIEQKTKLEVDEVLENSEKVETKAGEKCLLNSSLLRLENLITMIDSPRNKGQEHKSDHVISNNVYLPPLNIFNNNPVYNLSNNNYVDRTDKSNFFSNNKQNIDQSNLYRPHCNFSSTNCSEKCNTIEEQLIELKDYKPNVIKNMHENDIEIKKKVEKSYTTPIEKEEKRKERADITPEIFQCTSSSAGKESRHSLLVDNIDIEKSTKRYTCMKDFDKPVSSQSSSNSDNISRKDITLSEKSISKQETNVPKILSDKIITVEEMPLALQRVLRQTGKRRKFPSTIKNDNRETEVKKIKDATSVKNPVLQTNLSSEKKHAESSVGIDPLSTESAVVSAKTESNKDVSCITSSKNMPEIEINRGEKNTRKYNNETHRNLRSASLKHGSPRKLQDITEDFYNDLMYMHNKDNAIQQRCLRQRRRSVNNPKNIKNRKMSIEMLKFIQDITEGAKVVVKRLNIDKKSSLYEKNSSLATYMH